MRIYRNEPDLLGVKKTVITVNYHESDSTVPVVETKTVNQLHHIQVIDRSGSMWDQMDRLVDQVQKTLDIISDDDLLTVIWFSSPGDYKTLIKGARKSQAISDLMNSLRSTRGCTCFSDPMKEVNTVIDDLYALCPNISVTLFTDGQAVVPWTRAEEERRVFAEVDKMKGRILALNTIGYGAYYNQEMLQKMADSTEFGIMVHSSEIDDYLKIFTRTFETISDLVSESAKVEAPGCEIIYLTRNFTRIDKGEIELNRLASEKNQFFIIGEGEFNFTINGNPYSSRDITTKGRQSTILNLYYSLAYNRYYHGKRLACLDLLATLGDKGLIDSQASAFTADEVAAHQDNLYRALFFPKERLAGGTCDNSYVPAPNALCVLDVLTELGNSSSLYIPFGKNVPGYTRTTRQTVDEFNVFQMGPDEVRSSFSGTVTSSEFLNLSIHWVAKGFAKLNPKQAASVGLDPTYPCRIDRNHSIILDGHLNVKQVEALLDPAMVTAYGNAGFVKMVGTTETIDNVVYQRAVFDFTKLPIINRTYIDQSADITKVFDNVKVVESLAARQKVLKYWIDKVMEANPVAKKTGEFQKMTVDQITLLSDHGIKPTGIYDGISKKTKPIEECDSYEVRLFEFVLQGMTSLPKIDDVLKKMAALADPENKKAKALTPVQKLVADQIDYVKSEVESFGLSLDKLSVELQRFLDEELARCKANIRKIRVKLNGLKMAKTLTGDWFDGLETREIKDKTEYVYTSGDDTMIIKVGRVKRYV